MTEPPEAAPAAIAVRGHVRSGSAGGSAATAGGELAPSIAATYDAHRGDLFSFAAALVRDPDAADDLVAEAFLRLLRETREDRAPDDPRAWLHRVVANLSLSRGRRLLTAQRFVRHLVDRRVGEAADAPVLRRELPAELERALLDLKADPPDGGVPLKTDPFAIGGPLHCSGILQMRPIDAEHHLLNRGIRLSWRFVTKTGPNMGFSDPRLRAPATGWISGTALGSDGELIVFVEDPAKPMANPIAAPADCPLAPS
jgi:hypothetical protein